MLFQCWDTSGQALRQHWINVCVSWVVLLSGTRVDSLWEVWFLLEVTQQNRTGVGKVGASTQTRKSTPLTAAKSQMEMVLASPPTTNVHPS